MRAIPLVRAASARPLLQFLESGGASLRPLRERLQPAFRARGSLLPVAYVGGLFDEVARLGGVEDVGLRIGCETPIETFGDWGALIASSDTVGAFLQAALANYRRFNSGYCLWSVVRGDEIWLQVRYAGALQRGRAHVIDLSLMMWIAAFRAMRGPTWRPREIHLEGDPPRHAREIEALATHRVAYRRSSLAIVFSRDELSCPTRRMSVVPMPSSEGPDPAPDFAGSVQQAVESLLRLGVVDLSEAAAAAGMSERSFQRRLADIGLSFSGLVEDARFDVARSLLANRALRVIDVSTELGYRDSANFTRAFRRWSGVSPQLYRRAVSGHSVEPLGGPRSRLGFGTDTAALSRVVSPLPT